MLPGRGDQDRGPAKQEGPPRRSKRLEMHVRCTKL